MEIYNIETVNEITYKLYAEQDDMQVRGNALASGDDEEDRRCEDEILERLDSGDVWAWASVKVEAEIDIDGETFTGEDYLGACSYVDEKDFMQDGYYDDMKAQALQDLIETLERTAYRYQASVIALKAIKNNQLAESK
jgi:hypothetical protein